jgi:hypothetical protein
MTKYSERTIRRKALEAGFKVEKGFQHYNNGAVVRDCNGEAYTGYMVFDYSKNTYVWDSYNQYYDHVWTLEDVENFIKAEYEKAELEY